MRGGANRHRSQPRLLNLARYLCGVGGYVYLTSVSETTLSTARRSHALTARRQGTYIPAAPGQHHERLGRRGVPAPLGNFLDLEPEGEESRRLPWLTLLHLTAPHDPHTTLC